MVYVRKPKTATSAIKLPQPQIKPVVVQPVLPTPSQAVREIQAFTTRPSQEQKQVVRPAFTALQLQRAEHSRVEGARPALQAQIGELAGTIPPNAIQDALQRQEERNTPPPVIQHPQTQSDWVTVMRQQAIQAEGRRMGEREVMHFTALQRQVAQRLVQGFRTDRQPAAQRYAEYAGHLVSLQRHPISGHVANAVMTMIPQGERPALQRAVDEVLQREAIQRQQDETALNLHTLQRQLAELDEQATQPVFERIQARRGAGNPLPEAVQRHLEQGLNHDLSGVRIHDDAEADKLAKGMNAIAFTTGKDIYFQSGKFNPNTQAGIELLAHEVTHTVQQSKGQVGKGIDPSASHETEAQDMGRKLAVMPSPKSLIPPIPHKDGPHAPGIYNQKTATERIQSGAANHALLNPLRALQRQPDLTIQRSFVGDKLSELAGNIPGYKPLTLALGYDPVAGKAIPTNPNALLDALGNFVPGPFKDMVKVIREQKLVDKAWTWFKAELSKLQLGKVITDIKGALSGLPNIGKAKSILETAASKVRNLVTGSARKLAEIAITAITAGLGPVGKRIMASLAQAGDIITQVLKNPGQFAKNLMNALKQGFTGFVTRSATWLQKGLGDFLTGSANIQMPKNLNVEGVLMTALSIMDLTYDALRGRLVKELGPGAEKKIAFMETAGGALGQLKGGVGKAPEMKSIASKVGGEVLGGIKTEVTETLVKKGIAKVALMFNPAGAAIGAIMAAWSTIQTVIDKGKQIMSVIMNALSSIREIAAGNVAGAARFIENTVGKALPVVFSFAANFLGIGNIGTRIKNLVKGMRQKLGIDKVINGIIARLKKIVGAGKQVAGQAVNAAKGIIKGIFGKKTFSAGKESHSIWFDTKSGKPQLWVASTPREARVQLHYAHREAGVNVQKSGGTLTLSGKKYTQAAIDSERDQGEAKIATALDAVSGSTFKTLDRQEKADAYFKQMANVHFNGIEQHFGILFSIAEANQTNRATLTPATYYFTCKSSLDKGEYTRQVGLANTELKAMNVETFLKRRTQVITTNNLERKELGVKEDGRDYMEGAAMSQIRKTAIARLEKLISITRDGTIQPSEQAELGQFVGLLNTSLKDLNVYRAELAAKPNPSAKTRTRLNSLTQAVQKISSALRSLDISKTPAFGTKKIKESASQMIGSLTLLHSLDQIGGGAGTVFPGSGLDAYGVSRINSSIGATWPKLAVNIEEHIRKEVSPGNYGKVSMSPITLAVN